MNREVEEKYTQQGYKKVVGPNGLWERDGEFFKEQQDGFLAPARREADNENNKQGPSNWEKEPPGKDIGAAVPEPGAPETSMVPIKSEMQIVEPVISVEQAIESWNNFQKLKDKLITDSDVMEFKNKKFIKKSGWRKFATMFNLSHEIIDRDIKYNESGEVIYAEFVIKAIAPNSRYSSGWASCSTKERSHKENKTDRETGRVICEGPCDGIRHFDNTTHNIPATAFTRALNRAISDMIAGGEVSAEEIQQ